MKTDDRDNKSYINKILSKNGSEIISFQTMAASVTKNRTKDDLIRSKTLNASAET
jgi:hypothetical protein